MLVQLGSTATLVVIGAVCAGAVPLSWFGLPETLGRPLATTLPPARVRTEPSAGRSIEVASQMVEVEHKEERGAHQPAPRDSCMRVVEHASRA
mmetsp:Transcript_12011/g.24148  ORF Transcript_12011/g.24148 Transcript_12011/m.24148 type:complete len:93 (-) Transcript_12011:139-417(-)|eukprot:CAMPEP_0174697510 /NCGR_PEP_ID=MMETSP1094-20130205/3355_1 /TAXON_ID=156173 /ORGANISM="Chrysochromulina brevifilum, Strain UTEX LB 985" /LENGTH=92 /DNA_ID=CAMNT_0015894503 /DNA_START=140 /DNA_END=418 /DNA_ORIENTATION=-